MRDVAGPFDLRVHQHLADSGHSAPKTEQPLVRERRIGECDVCASLRPLLRFETFLREVGAPSAVVGSSAIA
jgi:hypothetical protein